MQYTYLVLPNGITMQIDIWGSEKDCSADRSHGKDGETTEEAEQAVYRCEQLPIVTRHFGEEGEQAITKA